MGHIYARAACTISATDSRNSDGGLFSNRNAEGIVPRLIQFNFSRDASWPNSKDDNCRLAGQYLCDIRRLTEKCIEGAPLNARAWVSQERQLSGRIMHFTKSQLFWECYSGNACETYPHSIPAHAMPIWTENPSILKMRLHDKRHKAEVNTGTDSPPSVSKSGIDDDLYFTWCAFRIQYSGCGLSWDSDKLVALHGIAQEVGQVTRDKLVAGLWRSRIMQDLCWYKFRHHRETPAVEPTEWRAPTWSWANSNATIWVSPLTRRHRKHPGLCLAADMVELDVKIKNSGELECASIRIKCKPMQATLTPRLGADPGDYSIGGSLHVNLDGVETLIIERDNGRDYDCTEVEMDELGICEPQRVHVVVVQECLHEDTTDVDVSINQNHGEESVESYQNIDCLDGLFLRAHRKRPDVFERVGHFHFRGSRAVRQMVKARHTVEEKIITLI
jgi:hypothetical protein